ncbi:hypothetical protein [Pengzhenrongella phosphoraccumulans]|uniref:hypothetical protein n=1 Tax=Pengzhenrongella phosphoraccumulans TaxID=3114394 RepID=UPI00388E8AB1
MRELDEVLAHAEDERGRSLAGLSMSDDSLAVLTGRIRARRARRHLVRVAVVVPVAAAIALGGMVLSDRTPLPIATNSAPTSSPSPSPSSASAVLLPSEPGVPDRYALPEGAIGQAGPGWVLATYTPIAAATTGFTVPTTTVVVLASPDGMAYEVTRLDPVAGASGATAWTQTLVVDWVNGASDALVARIPVAAGESPDTWAPPEYATLDLTTGQLSDPGLPAHDGLVLAARSGQTLVWLTTGRDALVLDGPAGRSSIAIDSSYPVAVGPDGQHVIAGSVVVDVTTGTISTDFTAPRADGFCTFVSWWTADTVLTTCTDQPTRQWEEPYLDLHPRLVSIGLERPASEPGDLVRTLVAGDIDPWSVGSAWVADRQVVAQGPVLDANLSMLGDVCPDGAFLITDTGFTPLALSDSRRATVFTTKVAGGSIVVESSTGCVTDTAASVLTSVNLTTGAATSLLGLPAGAPPDGGAWLTGPASWTLGR